MGIQRKRLKVLWVIVVPGRDETEERDERRWWFTKAGPPCNKGEFGVNLWSLSVVVGYERAD